MKRTTVTCNNMDEVHRKQCWAKAARYKGLDSEWLHVRITTTLQGRVMPEKTWQGVSSVPFLDLGEVTQGVHFVHVYQAVPHDLCTIPYAY